MTCHSTLAPFGSVAADTYSIGACTTSSAPLLPSTKCTHLSIESLPPRSRPRQSSIPLPTLDIRNPAYPTIAPPLPPSFPRRDRHAPNMLEREGDFGRKVGRRGEGERGGDERDLTCDEKALSDLFVRVSGDEETRGESTR